MPFFFKPTSASGTYCGTEDDFDDDYVLYQSTWSQTNLDSDTNYSVDTTVDGTSLVSIDFDNG